MFFSNSTLACAIVHNDWLNIFPSHGGILCERHTPAKSLTIHHYNREHYTLST